MKMFARFDENPAMTLQDIKETKRYGRMHGPVILLPAHPASFAHNFASGMQKFLF